MSPQESPDVPAVLPTARAGLAAQRLVVIDPDLVRLRGLLVALRPDAANPYEPEADAPVEPPPVRISDPTASWGGIPAYRGGSGDAGSGGGARPPQVARLNHSKLSSPQRESPVPAAPGSAGGATRTKIPTPHRSSGSFSARAALGTMAKPSPLRPAEGLKSHTSLAAAAAHSMLPRSRSGGLSSGGAAPLSARGSSSVQSSGGSGTARRWA